MKTKITSVSLIFILIAPALTNYIWLQHQKSMVKHEVKRMIIKGIDIDELELLKFTKQESISKLKWEHSKEFEYKQKMYDVVKEEVVVDSIYYWCWLDREETKLNNQLAELVKNVLNTNPQKKEKQERLYSFYKSFYCSDLFNWQEELASIENNRNTFYLNTFYTYPLPPPTPPPQIG